MLLKRLLRHLCGTRHFELHLLQPRRVGQRPQMHDDAGRPVLERLRRHHAAGYLLAAGSPEAPPDELAGGFKVHDKVYLREFDKRNPEILIEGNAGSGGYTWYDYPARVADGEQANARAQVRLLDLSWRLAHATG